MTQKTKFPSDPDLAKEMGIEPRFLEMYGSDVAKIKLEAIESYERNGFGNLPMCMAKTHLSISSDPKLLGAPT